MLLTSGRYARRNVGLTTLLALILLMSGCVITVPTPPPSGTVPPPTPTAQTTSATDDYRAINQALCATLRANVAQALNVTVEQGENAAFQSMIDNRSGVSCRLIATGTGENFTHFLDVANNLVAVLQRQGWTTDPQYVADSPTGTILGLRRDDDVIANGIAVVQVEWNPAPGVECPADQPIATCAEQLEPSQTVYTISVDLAEAG